MHIFVNLSLLNFLQVVVSVMPPSTAWLTKYFALPSGCCCCWLLLLLSNNLQLIFAATFEKTQWRKAKQMQTMPQFTIGRQENQHRLAPQKFCCWKPNDISAALDWRSFFSQEKLLMIKPIWPFEKFHSSSPLSARYEILCSVTCHLSLACLLQFYIELAGLLSY